MDPYTVKTIMWQLLIGLSYMHQNWIIHRDLKVGGLSGCLEAAGCKRAQLFAQQRRGHAVTACLSGNCCLAFVCMGAGKPLCPAID